MSRRPTLPAATTWRLLAAFVVLMLASRVHLLMTRLFDPDEFEHLHAACCVARGQLPYRDFFEHHGPLPYYVLGGLVRAIGFRPELLLVHRALSFAAVLGTLALTAWLARRLAGRGAGLIAVAWLLSFAWFVEKSVEGRPDVPSMFFVTAAAACCLRAAVGFRRPSAWAFLGGACLGLAGLCTQKAVFLALGVAFGSAWTARAGGRSPWLLLAAGAAGVALPWAVVVGWFASHGAAGDFFRCVVVTPLTWPPHQPRPDEALLARWLGRTSFSPGHLASGAVAVAAGVAAFRGRGARRGACIPAAALLTHFAALPIMPAAYLQYYLLALPLAAVGVAQFVARSAAATSASVLFGILVFVAGAPALWGLRRVENLFDVADVAAAAAILYAATLTAAAFLWRGTSTRLPTGALGVLALALATPSLQRLAIQHRYWASGAGDLRRVAAVSRLAGPDGAVMDGFSGLGCLQPHATYWWWVNHHSLPLIRKSGGLPSLMAAVQAGKPVVILFDAELRRLGPEFEQAVAARYSVVGGDRSVPILLRNDLRPR